MGKAVTERRGKGCHRIQSVSAAFLAIALVEGGCVRLKHTFQRFYASHEALGDTQRLKVYVYLFMGLKIAQDHFGF